MILRLLVAIVLISALVSCIGPATPQPTPIVQTVVVTQIVYAPTATPYPTLTPWPTYTPAPPVVVTQLIFYTAIPPLSTSTPYWPTPVKTAIAAATPNVAKTATAEAFAILTTPRDDGFYLVGIDIAPGVWRSQGTGTSCYWQRSTKTGGIIDNHYGQSGGTIYIAASDFQIQFKGCGTWIYMGK